ncbi:Potassium voltage-gated channel subfamily S member 3 [Merluccius polli]|uniref:Delayed-rectifier potassium channel regulatory subunit KCNS1 n=1 Tax=Merluccius polli TaxID=89951 RepID=A0AA47MCQ1_MERPO|nr:Potassium voltage-gated channel subfamily S member 3 [Merluccius polli]
MGYGQILHLRGSEEDRVRLNVGGVRHQVERDTLLRFPHTRLARLLRCRGELSILELCDDYSPADGEYYFDRNPRMFLCVLNFYRTGCIHMMEELCVYSFSQEIEYWGIQELYLSPCCSNWYQERKEYIEDRDWDVRSDDQQQPSFDSSFEELSALDKDLDKFKGAWCGETRSHMWLLLEDPGYSCASKIIAVASLAVVLTSIVAMCVHSMPEFQHTDENDKPIEDPAFALVEGICIACFSAEFIIRLIVAPSQRKFLGNPLNIIDIASILPFYITLAFETDGEHSEENEDLENVGKVVQVLRLMRVFRILKLARHSIGLRALGATVRHSYQEVGLLLLFLSVGISIFSALIYFAEKEDDDTNLGTIPVGWWWATITMTTVGYGDTCPVTFAGKIVATLCIVCGLLVVALPISIIFNKFSKYYQRNKALEKLCLSQEKRQQEADLPYYNIRDLYTHSMYPFIGGLAFKSSMSSVGDETNASSLQGIEEVYDNDTC